MTKRMSTGRWMAIANAASKTWTPCDPLPKDILKNETVTGVLTPPAAMTDPGVISDTTPLSYLLVDTGNNNNFGLLDDANTCRGQNKVLVYVSASSPGSLALVGASLEHGNTHIVMMEGSRVDLTWAPQESGSLVGSHWSTSLRHSSSYAACASNTGPKAWLQLVS